MQVYLYRKTISLCKTSKELLFQLHTTSHLIDLDWELLEPSSSPAAAAAMTSAAAAVDHLSSAVVTTTSTVMSAPNNQSNNKSHTFPRPAESKKYAERDGGYVLAADDLDSDGILSDPYSVSSLAGHEDDIVKMVKDEEEEEEEEYVHHSRRGSRRHRQQQIQSQKEYIYDTEDTDRYTIHHDMRTS